jgi:hypothetical protein
MKKPSLPRNYSATGVARTLSLIKKVSNLVLCLYFKNVSYFGFLVEVAYLKNVSYFVAFGRFHRTLERGKLPTE